MVERIRWFAMIRALPFANLATAQQYPMLKAAANKSVQTYP
jgi:hypothetical protein